MTITVTVPEQLGRHAAAQGLTVEAFVRRLAQQVLDPRPAASEILARRAHSLVDLSASVRGLRTDEEADTLFASDADTGRPRSIGQWKE